MKSTLPTEKLQCATRDVSSQSSDSGEKSVGAKGAAYWGTEDGVKWDHSIT